MSRIEEIEDAINRLPPEDFRRLIHWIHQREQAQWDEQLDRDSASGRLDYLFNEADEDSSTGLLREWPDPK
jgi:hypothetical protein